MDQWSRWGALCRCEPAAGWLRIWADLGTGAPDDRRLRARAGGVPGRLRAGGRRPGSRPTALHVAVFVRELTSRPQPPRRERRVARLRGRAVERHDPAAAGPGPAVLRLPHRGGRAGLQPGRARRSTRPAGGSAATSGAWSRGWSSCRGSPTSGSGSPSWRWSSGEPVRNRVMLALAYDAALRREELCLLRTEDLDPARRTLRVRAETTKNRRGARGAVLGGRPGVLLAAYLRHRATISRARGPLFLSESRRNYGRAADLVDLVEGRAADRAGCRGAAVLHAYHQAPVPDRPGPDGLGAARDLGVRRAPVDRVDAALYPPVRPRPRRQAEPRRWTHIHAWRVEALARTRRQLAAGAR